MVIDSTTLDRAADTLRTWALDEDMKAKIMANPTLAPMATRVARRYIAGESIDDALTLLADNTRRGHRGSIECVGESVRDTSLAEQETEQFIELARRIASSDHTATLSFDLSHVGSIVSPELGLANVTRIAQAARDAGTSVMISAEGSDRTDMVLDLYDRLSADFPETGITLQARLRRTPEDLQRVMRRPGPVRVVKGAFLEPESVAFPRGTRAMVDAYTSMARALVRAGHRVNLATHDPELGVVTTSRARRGPPRRTRGVRDASGPRHGTARRTSRGGLCNTGVHRLRPRMVAIRTQPHR